MTNHLLSLTSLQKAFGSREILHDVSLGLAQGERVGLIGDNGSGKSTLLKIIARRETADGGTIALRKQARVSYLEQVPTLDPNATIQDVLESAFAPLKEAIARYEAAAAKGVENLDSLLQQIDELGGWAWQHHIVASAMRFGITDLQANVGVLSGGMKKRVALARLVLENADLVLLDEPTNHLDATTIDLMEEWLLETPAACILVTHDRYFLERVVSTMAELREGRMRTYRGHYSDYLEARAIEESEKDRYRHRRLQVLKSELEWARKSPKARTTKSRARLDRVTEAQEEQVRLRDKSMLANLQFGTIPRTGKTIVDFDNVQFAYDQAPLIKDFTLTVRPGERFGILGPNGAGKTTLLKLLEGTAQPTHGSIKRGLNTVVSYFDQHRTDVDTTKTLRENLLPEGGEYVFPGGEKVHVSAWLDRFAFRDEMHNMLVHKLSGGEKNRLAMAKFLLSPGNVLLLDEPTNDLDLLTLNLLEEALLTFKGCAFIVSHDRYFLDKVATAMVAFESTPAHPGRITVLQGDYTFYSRMRLPELAEEQQLASAANTVPAASAPKREREKQALTYGEKKELAQIEKDIEKEEGILADLESTLAAPETWTQDRSHTQALSDKMEQSKVRHAKLMQRWEELMNKAAGN